MSSKTALFASVVLALAGANLLQVWSFLSAFLFTDTLPDTTLFAVVFWIWFATAIVAAWCGLRGGYTLVRRGTIRASTLTTFAGMSCLTLKVGPSLRRVPTWNVSAPKVAAQSNQRMKLRWCGLCAIR